MSRYASPSLLARDNVQQLVPYQSARRLGGKGDVWLNANESPFAFPVSIDVNMLNRYPEPQPQAVIEGYATYCGLKPSQILVSRGADEAIELLVRAFCETNEQVLYCPPTYGMYAISSQTCGIETVEVPLTSNFQLDVANIIQSLQTQPIKLIFICSPNNPTGNCLELKDIVQVIEAAANKALVVVDEAYIEFCAEESVIHLLAQYPHLVILRTLSKAFSLAGLRTGFTLAHQDTIEILQKIIAPYPLSALTASVAAQALSPNGLSYMAQTVNYINAERNTLQQALETLACVQHIYTGAGNWLLVKFSEGNQVFRVLWDQGIILRNQNSHSALRDCVRITIGNEKEHERLLNALRTLS